MAAYVKAFYLKSLLLLPDLFLFKSIVYKLWRAFLDYNDYLEIDRYVDRFCDGKFNN